MRSVPSRAPSLKRRISAQRAHDPAAPRTSGQRHARQTTLHSAPEASDPEPLRQPRTSAEPIATMPPVVT